MVKTLYEGRINLAAIDAEKKIKAKDKLDEKLEDLFYAYDTKNNWTQFSAEQKVQSVEKVIGAYANQNVP